MTSPELYTPDWREAFRFAAAPHLACPHVAGHADPAHPCIAGISLARFDQDDVARVLYLGEGRPPRVAWLGVFALRDGRFAALRATACGGGWTCHPQGDAHVARTLEDLLAHGLSAAERERIGL